MFGLTMCHCLRKLFNVGSLFKLLFAYNTFVPFSFTGESTTTIYSRFTSLVRYDSTLLVYRVSLPVVPSLQDTAAKHDSCIY